MRALVVWLISFAFATAAGGQVATTGGDAPGALDAAPALASLTALAASPDGGEVVWAAPGAREGWTELTRTGAGGTETTEIAGSVVDLAYVNGGETLVGVQRRPLKRRGHETFLFSWPAGGDKTRRLLRLPPSTSDLAPWPAENALLLACDGEIRTLLLPDFRSGPLFAVEGANRAVSAIGGGHHVLVGRAAGLAVFDLSRPSGHEPMPVLAAHATDRPVVRIEGLEDGSGALTLLDDGTLLRIDYEHLALSPAGHAEQLLALGHARAVPDLPLAESEAVVAEVFPVTEAVPEVEPEIEPAPEPERAVPEEPEPEPAAEPEPPAEAEPAADPEPPAAEEPDEPEEPSGSHQLEGRVTGSTDGPLEAVLSGPDNILREAARVPVRDGRWHVDGLAPGRYRVQLDGGGSRVLLTEPRFLLVVVGEEPQAAGTLRVLRAF